MPRKPRMFLAGVPCHIISRGNNRSVCFFADADYLFYLECLNDACIKYGAVIHAYVLMTNHVHLLITPSTTSAIPKVMQSVGRRYIYAKIKPIAVLALYGKAVISQYCGFKPRKNLVMNEVLNV